MVGALSPLTTLEDNELDSVSELVSSCWCLLAYRIDFHLPDHSFLLYCPTREAKHSPTHETKYPSCYGLMGTKKVCDCPF